MSKSNPRRTVQLAALTQVPKASLPMNAEEHYWKIHEEIKALHKKKGEDYGEDLDPFANLRSAEAFGLPAHIGVLVRMEDKMRRLRTFAKKGKLANESVEDAFLDLANYAMLGLALFREQKGEELPW